MIDESFKEVPFSQIVELAILSDKKVFLSFSPELLD